MLSLHQDGQAFWLTETLNLIGQDQNGLFLNMGS